MLCSVCQNIFRASLDEQLRLSKHPFYGLNTEYHTTFIEFLKSVRIGCFICSHLYGIKSTFTRSLDATTDLRSYFRIDLDCRGGVVNEDGDSQLMPAARENLQLYVSIYTETERTARVFLHHLQERLPPYIHIIQPPKFLYDIRKVREWYETCKTSHHLCQRRVLDLDLFPTRIIDVGSCGDSVVKLIETKEYPIVSTHYLTLSHRWANTGMILLTPETLPSLVNGLFVNDLPDLFQEAIWIARELGIHYLWVDSLCVMQGHESKADWAQESQRMADYYANGQLNLVATVDSRRNKGEICSARMEQRRPIFKPAWTDRTSREYEILDKSYWLINVENTEILRRGWVFQERLLSTALLYFGRNEFFWQCHTTATWESFPEHASSEAFNLPTQSSRILSRESWYALIRSYSSCSLTYQSDKLAAFAGIAKTFQRTKNRQYSAGLWPEDFPLCLSWRSIDSGKGTRLAVAPTWSWASIGGDTYYPPVESGEISPLVQYIDVDYTDFLGVPLAANNSDTSVFTVRGNLLPVETMQRRDFGPNEFAAGYDRCHFIPDLESEFRLGEHYQFLPLWSFNFGGGDNSKPSVQGLTLKLNSDKPEETFRRFGYAVFFDIDEGTADGLFDMYITERGPPLRLGLTKQAMKASKVICLV